MKNRLLTFIIFLFILTFSNACYINTNQKEPIDDFKDLLNMFYSYKSYEVEFELIVTSLDETRKAYGKSILYDNSVDYCLHMKYILESTEDDNDIISYYYYNSHIYEYDFSNHRIRYASKEDLIEDTLPSRIVYPVDKLIENKADFSFSISSNQYVYTITKNSIDDIIGIKNINNFKMDFYVNPTKKRVIKIIYNFDGSDGYDNFNVNFEFNYLKFEEEVKLIIPEDVVSKINEYIDNTNAN